MNSKIVGRIIRNSHVLIQRGLHLNRANQDLQLQYFAMELHYIQKLHRRRKFTEEGVLALLSPSNE